MAVALRMKRREGKKMTRGREMAHRGWRGRCERKLHWSAGNEGKPKIRFTSVLCCKPGEKAQLQRRKNRESVQRGGINVRAVKIPSNGGERWTTARWWWWWLVVVVERGNVSFPALDIVSAGLCQFHVSRAFNEFRNNSKIDFRPAVNWFHSRCSPLLVRYFRSDSADR